MTTSPQRRRVINKPNHYRGMFMVSESPSVQDPRFATTNLGYGPKEIFRCSVCGTERKWGAHASPETRVAWLKCETCKALTKHLFLRVD